MYYVRVLALIPALHCVFSLFPIPTVFILNLLLDMHQIPGNLLKLCGQAVREAVMSELVKSQDTIRLSLCEKTAEDYSRCTGADSGSVGRCSFSVFTRAVNRLKKIN